MNYKVKYAVLYFITLPITLFTFGCMVTGPRFKPAESCPQDKAVVYAYRPYVSRFKAADRGTPYLYLDDKRMVPMRSGGYIDMYLEPGKHTFLVKAVYYGFLPLKTLERVDLELQAGQEYYLAFEQNAADIDAAFLIELGLHLAFSSHDGSLNSFSRGVSRMFMPVPKEIALPELHKTKYLGKNPKTQSSELKSGLTTSDLKEQN